MSGATSDWRLQALDRANEIRKARAELRRRLRRGEIFAASVLLDPPREAESWEVGDLLCAQRSWGAARTRKLLNLLRISAIRPVAELTDRQRRDLVQATARNSPSREHPPIPEVDP